LLEAGGFDGCVFDGEGAGNFGSSTTIDDAVIADKIAYDAESIVKGALGFVDDLKMMLVVLCVSFRM
jgi:hypothetical protein